MESKQIECYLPFSFSNYVLSSPGFSGGESRFNKALTRFNGFKPAIMAADKDWRSLYERLGINVGEIP